MAKTIILSRSNPDYCHVGASERLVIALQAADFGKRGGRFKQSRGVHRPKRTGLSIPSLFLSAALFQKKWKKERKLRGKLEELMAQVALPGPPLPPEEPEAPQGEKAEPAADELCRER